MFELEFTLYLGDMGSHKAKVWGMVTDSFGEVTARVTSCKLVFPPLVPTHKDRTLECLDLVDFSTRKDLEIAILERYTALKEKYAGQPEDWPRDDERPA